MTSPFILEPFNRNIPEKLLFENMAALWTKLGRQPKFRDCRQGLYSAHTYVHRFGTWRNALRCFASWVQNAKISNPLIEDVRALPSLVQDSEITASIAISLKRIADALEGKR